MALQNNTAPTRCQLALVWWHFEMCFYSQKIYFRLHTVVKLHYDKAPFATHLIFERLVMRTGIASLLNTIRNSMKRNPFAQKMTEKRF